MVLLIIMILFVAIFGWPLFIRPQLGQIKIKQYIKEYDVQLQKIASRTAVESITLDALKHNPPSDITPLLVAENIFQQYKILTATAAHQLNNTYSSLAYMRYLNTLTIKDFLDNNIPTVQELVTVTAKYEAGINKNREINIDKLCAYMSQHSQTSEDFSLASEVLDQMSNKLEVDRELSDAEIANVADRIIKEKAMRRAFDIFCDENPECKQSIFKREQFWGEIKRQLYKVDTTSVQCREIDSILHNPSWWEDNLKQYMNKRKTEIFKDHEEIRRLERETARMKREAKQYAPRRLF